MQEYRKQYTTGYSNFLEGRAATLSGETWKYLICKHLSWTEEEYNAATEEFVFQIKDHMVIEWQTPPQQAGTGIAGTGRRV